MIGRIGGSTVDSTPDSTTSTPPAPPTRILFAVGRFCVVMVPATLSGALFLGVNDAASQMAGVQGHLSYSVYEAL
jgi:hypothetical protein